MDDENETFGVRVIGQLYGVGLQLSSSPPLGLFNHDYY
jgi:hypothetical protein